MPCPICNRPGGPDHPPNGGVKENNVTRTRNTIEGSKEDQEVFEVVVQNALRPLEHKTLNEMRAVAAAAALKRGHEMGRWDLVFDERSRFRFRSRCKHCGTLLEIKNWKVSSEEAQRVAAGGFPVVQDKNAISAQDHVIVLGPALIIHCWESPEANDAV